MRTEWHQSKLKPLAAQFGVRVEFKHTVAANRQPVLAILFYHVHILLIDQRIDKTLALLYAVQPAFLGRCDQLIMLVPSAKTLTLYAQFHASRSHSLRVSLKKCHVPKRDSQTFFQAHYTPST